MTSGVQKVRVVVAGVLLFGLGGLIVRYGAGSFRPQGPGRTPGNPLAASAALADRGEDLADLRSIAAAESIASAIFETDSTDARALRHLSRARFDLGKFGDVIRLQQYALRARLEDAQAWGWQGDAHFELGRYRSADSCYYVMYGLDPGFRSGVRVARDEFVLRDFDKAIQYIDDAIATGRTEDAPARELAAAHVEMSEMLLSRGYVAPAFAHADTALSLYPRSVSAVALKARLLFVRKAYDAAAALMRGAVRRTPHPRYKALLARIYAAHGRSAAADSLVALARTEFDALAEVFPDAVGRERIEFYLEWNIDTARALRWAFAESRRRRDPGAYSVLAWAYYKNGEFERAWSSIGLALRKGIQSPKLYYRAAVIARAAGKVDRYRYFADKVRNGNPELERTYGRL